MDDAPKTRVNDMWKMARVGDILTIRNGYAVKSSDYRTEGVPLIRQSDINGDVIDISAAKRVPTRVMEECAEYLVREGDLLIGMSGSLGKIGRYKNDEPAIQNQRTGLLLLKPGFTAGFAKLVLKFVEPQIIAEGKGVAVQNVSAKEIEACTFPLPPEGERDRIVAEVEKQFTRLDAGVKSLKRAQSALTRYNASVLKAACEGRLLPTDEKNWTELTLPEFASKAPNSIRRGPFGSAIKKAFFVSQGYKVYQQQNAISDDCSLGNYFIGQEKFNELRSFEVKPNDLIISCSGTLGRIAIIPQWAQPGLINQALLKLTLDQDIVSNHFPALHGDAGEQIICAKPDSKTDHEQTQDAPRSSSWSAHCEVEWRLHQSRSIDIQCWRLVSSGRCDLAELLLHRERGRFSARARTVPGDVRCAHDFHSWLRLDSAAKLHRPSHPQSDDHRR
jgi:type I restriction enzyme S subunit